MEVLIVLHSLPTGGDSFASRVESRLAARLRHAGIDYELPPRPTVEDLDHGCRLLGIRVSHLFAEVEADET